MKKIILLILLFAISNIFAVSYNYAIGTATPSQTFQFTTTNNKFSHIKIEIFAQTNTSYFEYTMMGSTQTDTSSYIEISCNGSSRQLRANSPNRGWDFYIYQNGTVNITVSGLSGNDNYGSSGLAQWGVTGTITVTEHTNCPHTGYCSTTNCEYCGTTFCATHDKHLTVVYTHDSTANQPETTHSFCSNDENLIAQWNAQREGICPDCGKFICKLCPHSCADMPCPNGHYCVPTTCEICHGVYCSRHMLHLCQNYTEANNNTGNENINVQTTITGQAQVSVNITDNTQTLDLSSTNNILNQIDNNTRNIDNNTKNLNSKLDSLKGSIDSQTTALSNKLDGVKSEIESQTSSLGGKIDDAKSALNDMASQNHQDLNSLLSSVHGDMTGMENNLTSEIGGVTSAIGDTNSTLSQISGKLDNLSLDGDLNVDLGGLGGKIDSTNTKLDTILSGSGNLGLGSVGTIPTIGGIGSQLTENTLTGGEIENITKVTFIDSIKNKLIPPRLNVGSYDASFSFDIPTLFSEPLHLTIDMMDEKLQAVRQAVRVVSSLCMVIVFTFGIIRMIRQY